MKFAIASAVSAAALLAVAAGPAAAKPGPEVELRHVVARVAIVVEDRTDVAVEVEQGSSGLPPIRVERHGNEVRIDGGLGGRGFMGGDRIRNCRTTTDNPAHPGDGASVEVRNVGRVNLTDAPLIVIRTPRNVNVDASGAVFGSVGRGSASIDLGNAGCGFWNVANTEGPMSLSIGGSGDIRAGTSSALDVSIGGSGSVVAGATRDLDVSIGGSGDVTVTRVDGPTDISIGGSGDVDVRTGTSPNLSISVAGSGDVNFGGVAGDVDVSLVGGGDVTVARATGAVSRNVVGGGDVRIGQ